MFKHNVNHDKNSYYKTQSQIFNELGANDKIHSYLLNGFVGNLTSESIAKLQNDKNVAFIEEDEEIKVKFQVDRSINGNRISKSDVKKSDNDKITLASQVSAPWGISRISSGTNINKKHIFRYPVSSADDVTAYILDTGIYLDHDEFEGRATFGANFTRSEKVDDENGHGTHCAGVIGGKYVGIAKKSNLVSVKVLAKDGNGMLSSLIMGVDYVIRQHSEKMEEINRSGKWFDSTSDEFFNTKRNILTDMINLILPHGFENMDTHSISAVKRPISLYRDKSKGFDINPFGRQKNSLASTREEVPFIVDHSKDEKKHFLKGFASAQKTPKTIVNMSVGGLKSRVLDYALKYATDMGIHFSVAAGNDHGNACKYSPSSSKMVITAGASTKKDTIAFFSNYGQCVDLFAPGVEIESAWLDNKYKIVSGTSMAAPHVTGAMALYLSEKDHTPSDLIGILKEDSYKVIKNPGKTQREYPMVSIRKLLREIHEIEKKRA